MDTFPDVVANYQSRDKELSERERIAFCPVNTSQQNEELKRNVTAQHQLSSDSLEVCSDNDVACYQAISYQNFYGMPVIYSMEVFIKMMADFLSILEDISAHVMHCVCCHMHIVVM